MVGLEGPEAEFAKTEAVGHALESASGKTVSFSHEERGRILADYQAGNVIEGGDVMRYNPDGSFTQLRLIRLEGSNKVAVVSRKRNSEEEPSVVVFESEWDAQKAITESGNRKFDWNELIRRAKGLESATSKTAG